jgi:hypothetical protein
MKIFHHRINEARKLIDIQPNDGVEIDLRSASGKVILQHDPFLDGEDFTSWLEHWSGQDLILNVKEEGLENRILEILDTFAVKNYFFLDQSFPFMVKSLNLGNRNVAARVSDLESIETAIGLDCKWVWLDCFLGDWNFIIDVVPVLQAQGKLLCLVSPELVRIETENELRNLQNIIAENHFILEAVCTKSKSKWVQHAF